MKTEFTTQVPPVFYILDSDDGRGSLVADNDGFAIGLGSFGEATAKATELGVDRYTILVAVEAY